MQFRERSCNEGLQSYGHFCAQVQSKTQKRIENDRIFTFQMFVKKANHPKRFNDYDHRNHNFTVSEMIVKCNGCCIFVMFCCIVCSVAIVCYVMLNVCLYSPPVRKNGCSRLSGG